MIPPYPSEEERNIFMGIKTEPKFREGVLKWLKDKFILKNTKSNK